MKTVYLKDVFSRFTPHTREGRSFYAW